MAKFVARLRIDSGIAGGHAFAFRRRCISFRAAGITIEQGIEMGRHVAVVLYVVAMAAVIVGVDLVFFRNRFWERLTVNIVIVLVFAAFYFRFLRRP